MIWNFNRYAAIIDLSNIQLCQQNVLKTIIENKKYHDEIDDQGLKKVNP